MTNPKLLLLFFFTISLFSCGDSCDETLNIPSLASTTVFDADIAAIENYLNANGLEAQKTDSGLHYIIDNEGEANVKPELCDEVTVAYKGFLLDGSEFDASEEGITFSLLGVILGWQEGIPLFGKNGSGTLLIPSYLGYGTRGNGSIGSNEVLIFEVELLNF